MNETGRFSILKKQRPISVRDGPMYVHSKLILTKNVYLKSNDNSFSSQTLVLFYRTQRDEHMTEPHYNNTNVFPKPLLSTWEWFGPFDRLQDVS